MLRSGRTPDGARPQIGPVHSDARASRMSCIACQTHSASAAGLARPDKGLLSFSRAGLNCCRHPSRSCRRCAWNSVHTQYHSGSERLHRQFNLLRGAATRHESYVRPEEMRREPFESASIRGERMEAANRRGLPAPCYFHPHW